MAGYVRELLRDLSLTDEEELGAGSDWHVHRIDLYEAITRLYDRGTLDDRHILALEKYYLGDSGWQTIPGIDELLSFALKQIEQYAGVEYTDEVFIKRCLTKYPNYSRIEQALVKNLIRLGDTFELA